MTLTAQNHIAILLLAGFGHFDGTYGFGQILAGLWKQEKAGNGVFYAVI